MTAERDAVVEAMARAMMEADGISSDYWNLATAAYDAALPLIVGPLRELAQGWITLCDLAVENRCSTPAHHWRGIDGQQLVAILDALPGGDA